MVKFKFIDALQTAAAALVGLVCLQAAPVKAETISQIESPFAISANSAQISYQSQFDAILDPLDVTDGAVSDFATVYDDFTFANSGFVTEFSWVGGYFSAAGLRASGFEISIFNDVDGSGSGGFASEPAASSFYSQTVTTAAAGEALTPDLPDSFFSYSAAIPSVPVVAGNKYWFSVVAQLDADIAGGNDWGVAASDLGPANGSFQDFQDFDGALFLPVERFQDSHNYAFAVTAVPEPGTLVGLIAFAAGASLRRRRR